MDASTTYFDQRPTHNPTTRSQQLRHAAVVLDIQRCAIADTDPALSYEMLGAIAYVMGYVCFDLRNRAPEPEQECTCRPDGDMCRACAVHAAKLADFDEL